VRHAQVDKKLIGGFVLEFEDRLVDLSTKKKVRHVCIPPGFVVVNHSVVRVVHRGAPFSGAAQGYANRSQCRACTGIATRGIVVLCYALQVSEFNTLVAKLENDLK
jgi:hypothetical protein